MRVLVLNPEYPPLGGGAANATKYLFSHLRDQSNLTVECITASADEAWEETIGTNIRIHALDIRKQGSLHYYTNRQLLRYSQLALIKARQLHAAQPFDLIHAWFGIPSGVIAYRLGLPYLISLRGSDVPYYNPRFRLADRLVFSHVSRFVWKRAKAVVANSQQLADLAARTASWCDIPIIQNGVDTTEFSPAAAEPPTEPLRILCVSRLIERKGLDRLIAAVADIHQLHPTVQLVVAGDGNIRPELEAQARALDITNHVEFLGAVPHDQLPALYRQCHIFALPSRNEGMSNTALEALASGLPLVLTDTGGADELTNGNGSTVAVDDQAALNAALLNLISDHNLRQRYRVASRQKAERYSWGATADAYLSLYRTVGASGR